MPWQYKYVSYILVKTWDPRNTKDLTLKQEALQTSFDGLGSQLQKLNYLSEEAAKNNSGNFFNVFVQYITL